MNGKEIVNLINKLQAKGLSSDEIIEIIKYIELTDPKYQYTEESADSGKTND